jgi:hypothetical protein
LAATTTFSLTKSTRTEDECERVQDRKVQNTSHRFYREKRRGREEERRSEEARSDG